MDDRKTVTVEKISGEHRTLSEDVVVRESAVTLYLNDTELVTLICTPAHLRELCLGFLFAEGFVDSAEDIENFSYNEKDGLAWVETVRPARTENLFLKRRIASCCGRGRPSFYFANDASIEKVASDLQVGTDAIVRLRAQFEERAELFTTTGGAHGAAISNGNDILAFFEDVGRHNALDKLAGWCLLNGVPTRDKLLLFSGRVSSEILIKTARLGIPLIVSPSAPTDLALELAEQLDVTVVGFARGRRMNVYTRGERVVKPSNF